MAYEKAQTQRVLMADIKSEKPVSIIPPNLITGGDYLRAWRKWVQAFLALPTEPMDKDLSKVFIHLSLLETTATQERDEELLKDLGRNFLFQIIKKRLDNFKVPCTIQAVAVLAAVSSNPAVAVMLTHAMVYSYTQTKRPLGISDVAEIFPMGFPSEKSFHDIWCMQKYDAGLNDNLLDQISYNLIDLYRDLDGKIDTDDEPDDLKNSG